MSDAKPNLDSIISNLHKEMGTDPEPAKPAPITPVPDIVIPASETKPAEKVVAPELMNLEPEAKKEVEEVKPAPTKKKYDSYQAYIDDGNDPDFYQGPKAYENNQKILNEKREGRDRFKNLEDTMGQLVTRQNDQLLDAKKSYEAQLAEAKENEDFSAYQVATDGLNSLPEVQKVAAPQPAQELDVISSYRQTNPKLNRASPQFDQNYTLMFESAMNKSCMEAEQRTGVKLSVQDLQAHLTATESGVNDYLGVNQEMLVKEPVKYAQRVGSVSRSAPAKPTAESKMNTQEKTLYNRWVKSGDAKQMAYAAKMKSNFEAM